MIFWSKYRTGANTTTQERSLQVYFGHRGIIDTGDIKKYKILLWRKGQGFQKWLHSQQQGNIKIFLPHRLQINVVGYFYTFFLAGDYFEEGLVMAGEWKFR